MAGFVFFVNPRIIGWLKKQRRIYLTEALLFTAVLYLLRYHPDASVWIKELVSAAVAWSCGIAAVAYGARYLNHDHPFRKLANEAIYPFYLLHQPAIIIIGYYITGWEMPVLTKVLLITLLSFGSSVAVYWFFIRPFNFTRVLFGMRKRKAAMKKVYKPATSQVEMLGAQGIGQGALSKEQNVSRPFSRVSGC
jgi:peptidoglycan/LPS O-acetylase OafA/YrhL